MTHSTISLGVGLGGGRSATSSGRLPSGGAYANELSASFDGSDDRLTIGSGVESVINNASTLSVSAWFKLSANSGAIFSSGTSGTNGFWLYPYNDSLFIFAARNSSGQSMSVAPPSLNNWHHVCGVLNGDDSVLYIDGSAAATGTLPALGSSGGDSPSIGSFLNTGGFINGLIDEVAIFSSALSATDVTSIYNSGVPADLTSLSPAGWWRMGENDSGSASGTIGTVTDQGSGANNATGVNGAIYSSDVAS